MSATKSKVFEAEAFGARAREARAYLDVLRAREGKARPTVLELSEEMAKLVRETVSDRDVGKWLRGEAMPGTLLRFWGFARVLGVDAGWLAFDGESTARGPTTGRPALEDDVAADTPRSAPQSRRRA